MNPEITRLFSPPGVFGNIDRGQQKVPDSRFGRKKDLISRGIFFLSEEIYSNVFSQSYHWPGKMGKSGNMRWPKKVTEFATHPLITETYHWSSNYLPFLVIFKDYLFLTTH